jgi:hypothetical protein
MTASSRMAAACGPDEVYPSVQRPPFHRAHLSHFHSAFQYAALSRSDLTSYLQFYRFRDLAATMPSDQDEVDMETFQRLSDNYQPDVQVRLFTGPPTPSGRSDIYRVLSFATDIRYKR